MQSDLIEFVELLIANEVEFVVVGAYAVAFHGHSRYTQDIDFFVRSSQSNAEKLELLIAQFGFASLGLSAKDFYNPDVVIQLGRPPNRIDLITAIDGVAFNEAWENSVTGNLGGLSVRFIDCERLIRNKRSTGRLKDEADAEELERLAAAPLPQEETNR
jgi:predicted nucleotidyltransferase